MLCTSCLQVFGTIFFIDCLIPCRQSNVRSIKEQKHQAQAPDFSCHKLLCNVKSRGVYRADGRTRCRKSSQSRQVTGIQRFILFAGVIMPAISITVEATTHMCAETFFDPIPTMWHLMLVIFVPLAQLHVWFAIRRGAAQNLVLLVGSTRLPSGVSLFYSFVYLPLLPLAALTLLFVIGLLPLAPLLSLVAATRHACSALAQIAAKAPQKKLCIMRKAGLLTGLVIVAAFDWVAGTSCVTNTLRAQDGRV